MVHAHAVLIALFVFGAVFVLAVPVPEDLSSALAARTFKYGKRSSLPSSPGFSIASGLEDEERDTLSPFGSPKSPAFDRHPEPYIHSDITSTTPNGAILSQINALVLYGPLRNRLRNFPSNSHPPAKPTWNALFDILRNPHDHSSRTKCDDILNCTEKVDANTQLEIIILWISGIITEADRQELKAIVGKLKVKPEETESLDLVDDLWLKYNEELMNYKAALGNALP
ncbi:hypothetical protein EV368DRAFT_81807 [Lentinula lateritia]|uniref:Uncharacterized protein n=1 Tax=Lentinula aff. lateritia TaxID=2804960 RepID=A0ACC1U3F9_9AGAR|nr:hypothetical protein F5876DRAFT_64849 [Lentinula aff. lateritia]KAJ3853183.1 hypothetical protein EV368DRAFT_81807 [Lentinula lateritia]